MAGRDDKQGDMNSRPLGMGLVWIGLLGKAVLAEGVFGRKENVLLPPSDS